MKLTSTTPASLFTRTMAASCALSMLAAATPSWGSSNQLGFPLPPEGTFPTSQLVIDTGSCQPNGTVDVPGALAELKQRSRETQGRIVAKEAKIEDLKSLKDEADGWMGANMIGGLVAAIVAPLAGAAVGLTVAATSNIGQAALVAVFFGPIVASPAGDSSISLDDIELSKDQKDLVIKATEQGIPVRMMDLDKMSLEEIHAAAFELISSSREAYDRMTDRFTDEPETDFLIDPYGSRDNGYLRNEIEQAEVQLALLKSEQKMIPIFAQKLANAGGCQYKLW